MTFLRFRTPSACLALLATAAIGGSLTAAGCEVIVPNDAPTPTCTMTPYSDPGNGTCPKGMYCDGTGCKACQARDICDGFDNDCDGIIDDGPYSDKDGDGYTSCGKTNETTGAITLRDCVDNDAKIYPGADEICNGKDDNCDGIIDNPDLVCPPNETCVPTTGQCISNTQVCVQCSKSDTPGCCADPNVCDMGTQQCVPNGTQDAGTSCSGDLACSTGICSDPAELGSGVSLATCTTPCCTSADCSDGSVCWGAGTGGNYCIPASAVSRGAPGTGAPGTSCTGNGDCRSAVCSSNVCEDTCCSATDCQGSTTCASTIFSGNGTLACIPPPGSTLTNGSCSSNAQCASGFCACYSTTNVDDCHPTPGRGSVQLCAQPCCGSRQCPALTTGQFAGNQFICNDDYLPPAETGSVMPVCDAVQAEGTVGGNVGDPCMTFTDCFSNLCGVPTAPGACTDVCCVDSDCGKAGWVCRPVPAGTGTFLRCIPSP